MKLLTYIRSIGTAMRHLALAVGASAGLLAGSAGAATTTVRRRK